MKFACLGYGEENKWAAMSKSERDAMIEESFAYADELRKDGHLADIGSALQSVRTAKTLRWKNNKVVVTDGPFAETKEQLGGFVVLEARDIDHAVKLMSRHPCLRYGGPFEIRPVNEEALERQLAAAPNAKVGALKFACLGFMEEKSWEAISKSERDAMIERCIAFDEVRRKDRHWLGGLALQGVQTAKTLRSKGGKVLVTDGPFAETKEQLGGLVVIGIDDMNQAIELMLKHPGLPFGISIEIRPTDEELHYRCWDKRM
jgi:hypothetical protein